MTDMNEHELLTWYEQFKEALQGNGIDLTKKSDLFRVRFARTNTDGLAEMHYAFSRNGVDSSCSLTQFSINDPDYQEAYHTFWEEVTPIRRDLVNLCTGHNSNLSGSERNRVWAEMTVQVYEKELSIRNYMDDRLREHFHAALNTQLLPDDEQSHLTRLGRIRMLYEMAQSGQMFLLSDDPEHPEDFRQIYNTDNGDIVIGESDRAIIKKVGDTNGLIGEWCRTHGVERVLPPFKPDKPENLQTAEELGEEPPKPSRLRRFLCSRFSFFDRHFGQKVAAYDTWVQQTQLREEYEAALQKYKDDMTRYNTQLASVQYDTFREKGMYPNNENIGMLREASSLINQALTDFDSQDEISKKMADQTLDDNTANSRLNEKNNYMRRHQVLMTQPGVYSPDGQLTEKGKTLFRRERTHIPDVKDYLTVRLKKLKDILGAQVAVIDKSNTNYAEYVYLKNLQQKVDRSPVEQWEQLREEISPWSITENSTLIKNDPAFQNVLKSLDGRDADADAVVQAYTEAVRQQLEHNKQIDGVKLQAKEKSGILQQPPRQNNSMNIVNVMNK